MRVSLVVVFFLAILAGGCASTETLKKAQGQGVSRVYMCAYDPVFDATLAAAKSKKLEVGESDKSNGRLILSRGITLLTWGERIAIFLKPVATNSTEVEIISKCVFIRGHGCTDWQPILHEQIHVDFVTVLEKLRQ